MKEKVILKSAHPEEYPDLVVECRVIQNDEIGSYLDTIPEERKFYAHKTGEVLARQGKVGEEIKTSLKTIVDGREYILSEVKKTVKERNFSSLGENITVPDMVITNISSTSNEEYVVRYEQFAKNYTILDIKQDMNGNDTFLCIPNYESRLLTQIDENIIIITNWGEPAVCLAGSYIVTYNAAKDDYNTLEQGAYKSTYTDDDGQKALIK